MQVAPVQQEGGKNEKSDYSHIGNLYLLYGHLHGADPDHTSFDIIHFLVDYCRM